MGHKDNRVNEFRLPLEKGRGGQVRTIQPPVAEPNLLLLSNTTEAFFNVRGTWHFSQHGAPLWFAVRLSVLWPDDPSMYDARGTPFNHLGHTTQLLCGQSALTNSQGSERLFSRLLRQAQRCCRPILVTSGPAHGAIFLISFCLNHPVSINMAALNASVLSLISSLFGCTHKQQLFNAWSALHTSREIHR